MSALMGASNMGGGEAEGGSISGVVVQVIADSRVQAVVDIIDVHAPFLRGYLFAGLYSDISPNWHRFIGRKMMLTLLIQAAVIVARTVATFVMLRWSRSRSKHALTQPDMNRCAPPPHPPRDRRPPVDTPPLANVTAPLKRCMAEPLRRSAPVSPVAAHAWPPCVHTSCDSVHGRATHPALANGIPKECNPEPGGI